MARQGGAGRGLDGPSLGGPSVGAPGDGPSGSLISPALRERLQATLNRGRGPLPISGPAVREGTVLPGGARVPGARIPQRVIRNGPGDTTARGELGHPQVQPRIANVRGQTEMVNRAITPIPLPKLPPSPTPHVFTVPGTIPGSSLPAAAAPDAAHVKRIIVPALIVNRPAWLKAPLEPLGYRTPEALSGAAVPLYRGGVPRASDIEQAPTNGNCWALAIAGAVVSTRPGDLTSRLQQSGAATTMEWARPVGPNPSVTQTTVDAGLPLYQYGYRRLSVAYVLAAQHNRLHGESTPLARPMLGAAAYQTGALWPAMFEKNLAAVFPEGYERFAQRGGNAYETALLMEAVTARRTGVIQAATPEGYPTISHYSERAISNILHDAVREQRPVVVGFGVPEGSEQHQRLASRNIVNNHAYWFDGFTPEGNVKLGNPHGFAHPEIPVAELRELAGELVVGLQDPLPIVAAVPQLQNAPHERVA